MDNWLSIFLHAVQSDDSNSEVNGAHYFILSLRMDSDPIFFHSKIVMVFNNSLKQF